jgi:hypothetical protein
MSFYQRMKKKIDETAVMSELSGSKFFRPPTAKPGAQKVQQQKIVSSKVEDTPQTRVENDGLHDRRKDVQTDVNTDVVTSLLQDVNKRGWKEIIENTETHNSTIRLSLMEREKIEDVVRELRRKHKIKTSMNELARLGLLVLAQDFKKHRSKSIIADVKTS